MAKKLVVAELKNSNNLSKLFAGQLRASYEIIGGKRIWIIEETVWRFLKKLNIELPCDLAMQFFI